MLSSEIVKIVERNISIGDDVTYELICLILIREGHVRTHEEEDFIDLRVRGNVAKAVLYTMVRKRITTLVKQGKLVVDKDGKQVLVSLPENRILPQWTIMKEHMISMYPEWFNKREGGTNTGGGYSYLFRKFYDEVEDFLN